MALSPLDIHNKEFSSKFRGYDEDEVNEFLEQIMKDYENVLKENKSLKNNLKQSKEQVSHFNSIEETFKNRFLLRRKLRRMSAVIR